jgi:transposase
VQVVLGVVMVAGFPIASHVFAGNRNDKTTVQEVVKDVQERFGLRSILFVADKGMLSPENRKFLECLESCHYILGHPGRRNEEAQSWLERATDRWLDCGRGTRVQEVQSGREGLRVLLADSEERRAYEAELRERSMARAEEQLKRVLKAVEKGRLKQPDKIAARAARALQQHKGYRYFSYRVPAAGKFEYFADEKKLAAERLREGRYLLTTNHPTIDPREAVARYKELSDLEDGFRSLKDVIQGRPVWHKTDRRVCAHLFVAQLSLLLLRLLRERLERAALPLSPREALQAGESASGRREARRQAGIERFGNPGPSATGLLAEPFRAGSHLGHVMTNGKSAPCAQRTYSRN